MKHDIYDPGRNSGQRNSPPPDDILAFLGAKQCFSDTLLRTISSEITDVSPARFDTPAGLQDHIVQNPESIRLIVVDARQCRGNIWLCENIMKILKKCHVSTGLAIAFWESDLEKIIPPETYSFPSEDGISPFIQGFVPMNQNIDIWLSVIRLLACGGTYFPPDFFVKSSPPLHADGNAIADTSSSPAPVKGDLPKIGPLTIRETEVMEYVISGLQNKQIASKMGLSEHTVKLHMHHIITKLSAKNRTEAAMRFVSMKAQ